MSETAARPPFVTVVVPCRNEALHVQRCIASIVASEHPKDRLEAFFVDGMSDDGTREFLWSAANYHPWISVLDNPKRIVPAAMNIGIRKGRGDVFIRMDAHSEFPPDYIPRCLRLLEETGAGNAGGRVVNQPNGTTPWARAVAFATQHVFGVGNGAWRTSEKPGFVDTVPCGVFKREILAEIGLFDERLTRNQDNELNARLTLRGYKIAFDPTIRIRYWNQGTLEGLARQGWFTGMWNVYTLRLHPFTFKWRRFVPGAFALYLLLAPLVSAASDGPLAALAWAPAAAYGALASAFSLRGGPAWGGAPRIFATFACYHLAYGFGTLLGAVNLLTGKWRSHLGRPLKK